MSMNTIQPSFAAGELAPNLWARVDLAKYHIGAKTLRNFFVLPGGGASNRPGTAYVGRCKDQTNPVRLLPFQFNTLQTYILEFGQYYMRVITNGGYVLETAYTIASAGGNTNTAFVNTTATTNFSVGDWVFVSGSAFAAINSVACGVALVSSVSGSLIGLTNLDGGSLNVNGSGAGGTIARFYTLTTPYLGSDLATLKFVQSADTMTLTHPSYAPRDLTRTGNAAWTLTTITFQPSINPPGSVTYTNAGGMANNWTTQYVVTSCSTSTGEESLPSSVLQATMTNQLNQNNTNINNLSWSSIGNANYYRVYRSVMLNQGTTTYPSSQMYGYIGQTSNTNFSDANFSPDFTQSPPSGTNPFASSNNPGVVTYFQNRKVYAGSNSYPTTLWMSQPSAFKDMNTSNPTQDSDAITATITNKQVNAIKHLVSVNELLALTSGGSFKISGGQGAAITPSTLTVTPQAYNGCSDVPPIVVGNDILYVQAKGSRVRDLSYNFYADVFTGSDMTIMAPHLFYAHQILEWAYAEEPFNLIWAVRDDGIMLGFTYLKEQDVYAWTRHDTNGLFKSVASVSEGTEDAVYTIVQRTIPGINSGNPVKYVERMASRNFMTSGVTDITKAWFVDCGVQYSGTATTTVTLAPHLNGATVTILGDGNVFPNQTVVNGAVTLPNACSVITIGLPYVSQLQTLNLDYNDNGGSVQGKRKKVSAVTVRMENCRGLKVGHNFTTMTQIKERSTQIYGSPVPMTTGDERVVLDPLWETSGSVCIQQDNPLPATVLAVIPEVRMGDSPG